MYEKDKIKIAVFDGSQWQISLTSNYSFSETEANTLIF
jgi:hypothetical protein